MDLPAEGAGPIGPNRTCLTTLLALVIVREDHVVNQRIMTITDDREENRFNVTCDI
jgi:hypothetical protein